MAKISCLPSTPSCLTLNVCPTQLCVRFEEIGAKLKLNSYPNGAIDLPEAYTTSTGAGRSSSNLLIAPYFSVISSTCLARAWEAVTCTFSSCDGISVLTHIRLPSRLSNSSSRAVCSVVCCAFNLLFLLVRVADVPFPNLFAAFNFAFKSWFSTSNFKKRRMRSSYLSTVINPSGGPSSKMVCRSFLKRVNDRSLLWLKYHVLWFSELWRLLKWWPRWTCVILIRYWYCSC